MAEQSEKQGSVRIYRLDQSRKKRLLPHFESRASFLRDLRGWLSPQVLINLGFILIPLALVVLAGLFWASSLSGVNLRGMTDIGLLSVLSPGYYIALVILLISFCMVVFYQPHLKILLFLHIVGLIIIIHGTPVILYGTLRYAWAWKHVGIVDYIQRHGSVDPNITFLSAYHNWPGFFALNALFTEASGLNSSLDYASWSPVFFNLLFFGGIYLLFSAFTRNQRLVWMAILFFFLGDWVGQDYFAPQAFGYFFYLVTVGILLNWFYQPKSTHRKTLKRWLHFDRVVSFFDNLNQRVIDTRPDGFPSTPLTRVILMVIVILMMIVLNVSHQLTPLMLICSLTLLALTGQTYTRTLPILAMVLMVAWMWFVAYPFMGQRIDSILTSFGMVSSNISGNLINLGQASTGQVVVSWMGRGLTLLVIVLGGLGYLYRFRHGYIDLAALLLIFSPFLLLLGNAYGGEIVFRVFLFGLPPLAFGIGALFAPEEGKNAYQLAPFLMIGLSLVMLTGLLFAYYGKEKQYYFSPDEAAATAYLFNTAPPGSLIVEGTRNYPTFYRNYEYYTYVPIEREPIESRLNLVEHPVEVLSRWMGDTRYTATYLIITHSQKAEIEMVHHMPPGALDKIDNLLVESGQFITLFRNQDAVIFVLRSRVNEIRPQQP